MSSRITFIATVALLGGCLSRPLTEDGGGEGSTGELATNTTQEAPPDPSVATTTPTPPDDTTADGTEGSSTTGPLGPGLGEECVLHFQNCQPGLKCMPYSMEGTGDWWNATACFPVVPDPVGPGEPCNWQGYPWSGYDDCGLDQVCWTFSEEPGECKDLCLTEDPQGWDDYYCTNPLAVPYIGCQSCFCTCEVSCDPLADDCEADELCVGWDVFMCTPDASEDMGAYGDPCEYLNVCDPGLYCANAETVPGCDNPIGCCAPFCDLDLPDSCPDAALGVTCVPWFLPGDAPPGLEDLGACVLGG